MFLVTAQLYMGNFIDFIIILKHWKVVKMKKTLEWSGSYKPAFLYVLYVCRVRGGYRSPVCWPGRVHNQHLHSWHCWCSCHLFLRCQTKPVRWWGEPAGELWGAFTIVIHTSLKCWIVIAYCIVLIAVTRTWDANQWLLDVWILSVFFQCGYSAGVEHWDTQIYLRF